MQISLSGIMTGFGNNSANEPKISYNGFGYRYGWFGNKTMNIVQGEITADEYLKRANEKLNEDPDKSELNQGMKDFLRTLMPINNINKTYDEFSLTYQQEEINEAMWQKADADDNGYVDTDELVNLYTLLEDANKENGISLKTIALASFAVNIFGLTAGKGHSEEQIKEQIEEFINHDKGLDKNKDGILSRKEFEGASINYILTPKNNPEHSA